MNMRKVLSSSLVLLCSMFLVASSVCAQPACTPVVYAFRHAEDLGAHLTKLGKLCTGRCRGAIS